jgi:hypothetical protein
VPHIVHWRDRLLLAVDGDGAASGQREEVDAAVGAAAKTELDAAMDQTFAQHAFAKSGGAQQIHRTLFEDACPDALLAVPAAARFDDDGLDALQVKKMREQQAGRPGSDDTDLGSHW